MRIRKHSGWIAFAVLLVSSSAFAQQSAEPEVTVAFSDPARPGTLRISSINGSIRVTGDAGAVVRISDRRAEARRPRRRDGMQVLSTPRGIFHYEEENNVMRISTGMDHGALRVKVPARTNLNLNSVDGGEMIVEGVEGEIEVSHINGRITLKDVAGSVAANTVNGNIQVVLSRVDATKPMSFTSLNGDLDITLPANAKATAKVESSRGEVVTDFDVVVQPTMEKPADPPSPNAKGKRSGRSSGRALEVKINGGGPEYRFRTFNGDIVIRKAK